MYNRYLRNDDGVYTRVPMSDPPPEKQRQPPPPPGHDGRYRLLDKLPLKGVDKSDLLLLLILFFLFEEKADDELLIALGLLLIL